MHGRLCHYFLVFMEYSYCNRLSLGDIETIALYRTGGRGISKAEILVLRLIVSGHHRDVIRGSVHGIQPFRYKRITQRYPTLDFSIPDHLY